MNNVVNNYISTHPTIRYLWYDEYNEIAKFSLVFLVCLFWLLVEGFLLNFGFSLEGDFFSTTFQ